ncbi:hydroxyacylglutathione hydrolase [Roseiterribacter gracilis]|uniref:Hydroxyacylglutathione hydrolase n=1 Tax=Roseiterribacter gracilis TaxID=2812848 RepID=A0A8S8XKD2_9PROT|nr:hydroxyacylglutathione hydrolase [Rhodospirillales bacterium TMPK1]
MTIDVQLVPALQDNYIYLFRDGDAVVVVDPGDADAIEKALQQRGWKPTHILNTHHHADHIDGNKALKQKYGATLIAPAGNRGEIQGADKYVDDLDRIELGTTSFQVIAVPGHTLGHVAYFSDAGQAVFAGDTLFALGCGRMFEGTPKQFWDSLSRLRALPPATRLYCGHEYTQSNAKFALHVDSDNAALKKRAAEIDALRAAGKPTIPSTIGLERETNPYFQADTPAMQQRTGTTDAVACFASLRKQKDNF